MLTIVFVIAAYLLGSISFAVVTSKAFGIADPRTYGSGNPGATNVLRSGKKAAAALTLLGDAAKGWLAVFVAMQFGLSEVQIALVVLAVFTGHLFPIFLSFKGGKGVATALGVLLAVDLRLIDVAEPDVTQPRAVFRNLLRLRGRGPQFGNKVSHAHNVTKRRWNINLQKVRATVNGANMHVRVCTSCIKTIWSYQDSMSHFGTG